MRTPETEVDVLLTNLSAIYSELHPDTYPNEFIFTFFKDFYEYEHTCGDTLAAENEKRYPADGSGIFMVTEIGALTISCAYCAQAQRAWELGEIDKAWTYIIDARFWCSSPLSRRVGRIAKQENIARISKLRTDIAINARHKKYYEKPELFVKKQYLLKRWKNKSEAAKLITKQLDIYIKTIPSPNGKDDSFKA